MTKINIKGAVVSNDDADIYYWLGYDCVSPNMVEDVLNNSDGDVEVDIASGGGSVFAASEIYTMLKAYSGKVVVNIQGLAASAASVIAMAGDEINMSPTSQMMIHKASTVSWGNADDLTHDSKMLDVTDQSIVNAYEAKTGMDRNDILRCFHLIFRLGISCFSQKIFNLTNCIVTQNWCTNCINYLWLR